MSLIYANMAHQEIETPYLLLDLEEVKRRYRALTELFGPRTEIFYSVKANNHPELIAALVKEGSGFDVASISEAKLVVSNGCPPEKVAFSNPIKKPREISEACRSGVGLFALDSVAEIEKLSKLAPGSDIYVRLTVSNEGSIWPLTEKFGVDYVEATSLIEKASAAGLNPIGVTFHVGSQCLNPVNWGSALSGVAEVFTACRRKGIRLHAINMGGGLPAQDTATNPPRIDEIREVVRRELDERFGSDIRVMIEPGRHMVATAGTLVTSVIGKARRGGKYWIYLDAGVYNGLMEIYEDFPYTLRTEHGGRPVRKYVLAGPTCDSVDVIMKGVVLPELEVGDRVEFLCAGAYTISYDGYNGFPFPKVIYRKEKSPCLGQGVKVSPPTAS